VELDADRCVGIPPLRHYRSILAVWLPVLA